MPSPNEFSADFADPHAFIATFGGGTFHMGNPTFEPDSIAHALGHVGRWAGHGISFYSVAEHSVMVSYLVPKEHAFVGLMHDATEAYIADIAAPWKPMISGYKELEHYLWCKMADHWKMDREFPAEVKRADWRALFIEAEVLFPLHDLTKWKDPFSMCYPVQDHEPHALCLQPWAATALFLKRYNELVALRS